MVIASSMHPVLGKLRTLFLEGVTRSSKVIWSSVKIIWGTNNRGKAPPAITSEIRMPFKAVEIQASRIMLFAFFDPCLSHRDADAKLKNEQTSLAPFDDHMAAAHGGPCFQLRIDTVTVVKEISQISVVNKYSKVPDSGEARESKNKS